MGRYREISLRGCGVGASGGGPNVGGNVVVLESKSARPEKSKLPARLQDAIVVVRLVETLIDQGMRCDE